MEVWRLQEHALKKWTNFTHRHTCRECFGFFGDVLFLPLLTGYSEGREFNGNVTWSNYTSIFCPLQRKEKTRFYCSESKRYFLRHVADNSNKKNYSSLLIRMHQAKLERLIFRQICGRCAGILADFHMFITKQRVMVNFRAL